ncbi:DUF7507 domain-containing protein, partial [Imtechella halotolerans]
TTTFSATYTITQSDIDAGVVENQATATGKDPNDVDVSDTSDDPTDSTDVDPDNDGDPDDKTTTTLPQRGSISLLKTATLNDTNNNGYADVDET